MNPLERHIYNIVRFSPRLKKQIVRTYQFLFSIIPIKRVLSEFEIICREGYFYGFHDKCPWSADNKYLLAHKVVFDDKMPANNDTAEIGIFNGKNYKEFIPLSKTKTWNWQMGSMLQWIGNTNDIIYNDFSGDKHISKIIDVNGVLKRTYDRPISAINPDGNIGLSHSFVRLRKAAPAYSYANGEEILADNNCPDDDGLYLIDLKSGKYELIFSLGDFGRGDENQKSDYHYFTHCLFNPSGERFAFYHRWRGKNGQTWTKLFTSNINGKDLHQFDFSGVVTHLAWQSNTHLLAYGYKKDVGDHYYLLRDQTNEYKIIGKTDFHSDGHPQFLCEEDIFITDTYPDRFRRQYLIQFNLKTKVRNNIAVVRSPLKFSGDIRCDLHPRWDRKGKYICFDSVHTGKRSLCTVELG